MIGLGEELAALDSIRLRHHADGEQVVASIARSLTSARDAGWGDPDPYRALITTGEGTGELADLLSSPVPRLGAAVVSLGAPVPEATVDRGGPTPGGCVRPSSDSTSARPGSRREEASACAAIVDLTRESEPVRIAPFEQAADGWRALADQAGALREELTDVREEGPAGDGSLLPNPTEEYAEVAATTPEDVETLAPVVPELVRRTVEEADPTLDEDVAAWFDPESMRPRLILLGPVNARALRRSRPGHHEAEALLRGDARLPRPSPGGCHRQRSRGRVLGRWLPGEDGPRHPAGLAGRQPEDGPRTPASGNQVASVQGDRRADLPSRGRPRRCRPVPTASGTG